MDKRFLDKVVDQLVNETIIDYDKKRLYRTFSPRPSPIPFPSPGSYIPTSFLFPPFFPTHCKEVYGLNDDEVKYVWNEYRDIITDKINK